ncbi:hypothetical protein QFZ79_002160 [Arthrobacter sp. V4I6]|uniref:hypothetical protein n=1 Tax=Arthrobacter sp. V4I6 TaxID=3042281 RepID=UPI002789F6D4|nr:hypothetical protein [Arthrobacter sp. V4I6]MDQ0854049.1 hypothetical protein [Arthrobacter sp. V4I6]
MPGFELPPSALGRYAQAMRDVADADVGSVPTDSPEAAMRSVVLGTVLMESVLLAIRRLAQQSASRERFGAGAFPLTWRGKPRPG